MECRQISLVFLYLLTGCFSYVIKREAAGWYTEDDFCGTPNGKDGLCIPDSECQSKKEFLKDIKALTDREEESLKNYSCGSNGNDQKICCPLERFNLDWVEGDCKTPDNSTSRCIPIDACQPIADFLSSNIVGTEAQIALKPYVCGTTKDKSSYKVCCPSELFGRSRNADKDADKKDHSSHKNAQLLPSNCGILSNTGKIINGQMAGLFDFPWAAALKYNTENKIEFNCGGSLINSRYVLTAGHCITPTLIGVRLGEHNFTTDIDCELNDEGELECAKPHQDFDISAADITVHSQYNKDHLLNDIALIRLRREADLNRESVHPICLPLTSDEKQYLFSARAHTVIGWGITETNQRSKALLRTEVKLQENFKCKIDNFLNARRICAGGENETDACKGDSGGPLQSEYVEGPQIRVIQYGIVSLGAKICGQVGTPTTYTSVPGYVEWILDNIHA